MLSLSGNNQAGVIEAFNSSSSYLDYLLNIDNPYFEQIVGHIYPTELQLNMANSIDTEAPFFGLAVPWVCQRFVIVIFPDHTHLIFRTFPLRMA